MRDGGAVVTSWQTRGDMPSLLKLKHAETLSGLTGASKGQQKGAMNDAWESRKNHRHLLRLVDLERRLQLATEWEICRDP